MLVDSIEFLGSSLARNLAIESGPAFPELTTPGELFFLVPGGLHIYDGAAWTAIGGVGVGEAPVIPYDIAGSIIGKPAAGAVVLRFVANRSFTIPAGLAGAYASAAVAPTGAIAVLTLLRNGSSFGTITFAIGATVGTFAAASATSFVPGDILTVTAPAAQNAAFADVQFTLAATL